MKPSPLYQRIAQSAGALRRCKMEAVSRVGEQDHWKSMVALHQRHLKSMTDLLPSGAGFDSGSSIEAEACTEEKLILHTSFHHMDENGHYDGWTSHRITVTGSLISSISIRVEGRDRNQIKDHIHEVFYEALTMLVDQELKPVKEAA